MTVINHPSTDAFAARTNAQTIREMHEEHRKERIEYERRLARAERRAVKAEARLAIMYECPCGISADSIEDHDCKANIRVDGPDREQVGEVR